MVEKELRDADEEERFYVYLSLKNNLFPEKLIGKVSHIKGKGKEEGKKGEQ